MTAPTQGDVRNWARAQGMSVNARGSLPANIVAAYQAAQGSPDSAPVSAPTQVSTTADQLPDLAGALRAVLESIDVEVNAVNSLSDSIDEVVGQLNQLREEQATRLTVLDQLQGSVEDPSLGAFLQKAIRPRRPKVPEVVPARLQ